MRRIATFATLGIILGSAAFADSPIDRAIAHFNQDIDRVTERVTAPERPVANVTMSNRTASALELAIAHFNMDADRASDRTPVDMATLVPQAPLYGSDIFDRLAAESAEDE